MHEVLGWILSTEEKKEVWGPENVCWTINVIKSQGYNKCIIDT
jgi:hypothetical protein